MDERIQQLRALIRDAENLQRSAQCLLDELNERLRFSMGSPNSKDRLLERKTKPRTGPESYSGRFQILLLLAWTAVSVLFRGAPRTGMNWLAGFGLDPERNIYLRLSEADRWALAVKRIVFFLSTAFVFWLLDHLGLRTG